MTCSKIVAKWNSQKKKYFISHADTEKIYVGPDLKFVKNYAKECGWFESSCFSHYTVYYNISTESFTVIA